jgi:hypothetical protein
MLKGSVIVAVSLVIGWLLGSGALAFSQDQKPQDQKPPTATRAGLHQIHAAARALEQAHRHLERATHPFGGHRAKALELVKQAEAEVKEAVAFAKANPPAGSKPAPVTPPAAAPAAPGSKP